MGDYMKKRISILMVGFIFMIMYVVSVYALEDYSDDGTTIWDINGTTLRTILVTDNIASISIPDGVTKISKAAFCTEVEADTDFQEIESIYIPDSVQTIGELAFANCTSLQEVRLPEGLKIITPHMFSNCTSLEKIVIPDSVEVIEARAFSGCTSLKELALPKSLLRIEESAFESCNQLQAVVIPESVKEIGHSAFYDCTSLENIEVSENTLVKATAFYGTAFVKNQNVDFLTIGSTLVRYNGSCTDIILPDGITRIDDRAFYDNKDIKSVIIPDSVTEIGQEAFYGCTNLKDVVLSISLSEVGQDAFSNTEWKQINTIDGLFIMNDILWSYEGENESVVYIPLGIKLIADGAFYRSDCEKIVLSDTVRYIGQTAFANSNHLRSVYLPESIIKMGVGHSDFAPYWKKLYCQTV